MALNDSEVADAQKKLQIRISKIVTFSSQPRRFDSFEFLHRLH